MVKPRANEWATLLFGGAAGKLYRFRAAHLWRLDEGTDEYSTSKKYIAFESHAHYEASKHESPLVRSLFTFLTHAAAAFNSLPQQSHSRRSCSPQVAHIVARDELRRELWAAVAIAQLLGRVLVLPRQGHKHRTQHVDD